MIGLTFPAKVQGYMAAKKPVLGMIDGSCKKVINEASCGICVSAGDIKGFSDAIVKFSIEKEKWAEYGLNSRNYFLKNFRNLYIAFFFCDFCKHLIAISCLGFACKGTK